MRRVAYGLVVATLLSWATAATGADICPDNSNYTPVVARSSTALAYRITDCKGHESVIVGTLHSSDKRIIAATAYVRPYITDALVTWFELIRHPSDEKMVAKYMFLDPHEKEGLKDMLGEDDFAALVKRIHTRAPQLAEGYINRYEPWAAAIILQSMSIDMSGVVMDDQFQQLAIAHKRPVRALETIESQFKLFETLSRSEQITMLRQAIHEFDEGEKLNAELVRTYLEHNLIAIAELSRKAFRDMPNQTVAKMLELALVTDRNRAFARKLIPSLKRGKAFIAVGALHLPNEDGVLRAFERAGFGVYPLPPSTHKEKPASPR
jgi:uncharacterized protein